MTVKNWFDRNDAAQVQEIKTAEGLMIDAQLNNLIQAMAEFVSRTPTFNPASAVVVPQDQTLQATITASWHS